jgi:hypothetical protein
MGKRLTAVAVVIALIQASCLFVVPKTRRNEQSSYCADPKTKVAQVHVHKGASLEWSGCGGSCGNEAIIGLLLSPFTLLISGLYTIFAVGLAHDRTETVTTFEPRCGLVVPPLQPAGPPGGV